MVSTGAFAAAVAVVVIAGLAPLAALLFPALSAVAIWFGAGAKGLFSTPRPRALDR